MGHGLHPMLRKGRTKKISNRFRNARARDGFTLIEILIVVAIISVLAAIAIPQLSLHRNRAYNKAALSDLKNAVIAQEAYHADNARYTLSVASISIPPYNFFLSQNVSLTIVSADDASYHMEAYHPAGDVTYTVSGPGGTINP